MSYLIGIDLGTSAVKVMLFEPSTAKPVTTTGLEYPVSRPAPERAEQDPEDWWQASIQGVRAVTQEIEKAAVAAISFSGQMHGTVLMGKGGQVLGPALIWADQRSSQAVERMIREIGDRELLQRTGTLPAVGFQGPSLLWIQEQAPEIFRRVEKVLLPKDYLRYRMVGELGTDFSDAAGTGLFDVQGQSWAGDIIQALGLPSQIFPAAIPSTTVVGKLSKSAAVKMGLTAGIPVVAGCADQPAQALGSGLIDPGRASVTLGSGGQVFIPLQAASSGAAEAFKTDPRLHVFNHAVPDRNYVLGAILSAGLSLRWLRDLLGLGNDPKAYQRLSREAAAVPPGAEGLIFLPYLAGERAPHRNPRARGAFIGLTAFHQRGHLARAVMEGVAFALRQVLELSRELGGQANQVIASGGGSQSRTWRKIQADIYGLPLRQTLLPEKSALGAALLAGLGVGVYPDFSEACRQVIGYGPEMAPDPQLAAFYESTYSHFLELYPRLKDDFHRLGEQNPSTKGI